ncbi:MAG: outer membrane protein assembly factor BamA [Vicinamibacteria bacterium]
MPFQLSGRTLLAALALSASAVHAEDASRVARVEIAGTRQMPDGSYLFYVSTKPGDAYDDLRLRGDFRRLWETGFLDDLRLEVSDAPEGTVVTFRVAERARVRVVDFQGSKELSASSISERLKQEEAALTVDHFFDRGRAKRAEGVVKRMLGEKGYLFASVRHQAQPLGGSGVQVSFVIEDGLRARVRHLDFSGNQAFSDGQLRKRLKLRERRFWNFAWLTGADVYDPQKWEEDERRLRDFLLDRGHVQASLGTPTLAFEDGSTGLFRKKPVKWVDVALPVAEGDAFAAGKLDFRGLTVFREELVRPLFALTPGERYRESAVRKGHERLREAYGARGYPFMTARTERTPDGERRVVDVTVDVDEDKLYHVGRIRFTGNHTTRDAVLRREAFLNEGDVLSTDLLKHTVRRLNQLGYFKPVEAPRMSADPRHGDRLDLTFGLEEQSRNTFSLTGGTGGAYGPTLTGSFSTANLLGRGQTLEVAVERGQRYRNDQISVLEPYFLGRPLSLGGSVYRRREERVASPASGLPALALDTSAFSLRAGRRLGRFTRFDTSYTFAVIDPQAADGALLSELIGLRRNESRLTPAVTYDTVDSPFQPRRGLRVQAGLSLVGGPLGGSLSFVEPSLKLAGWLPHTRKTAFGLRFEAGYLAPFGTTALPGTTLPNGIPYDRRFLMGGEQQVRGFDRLTIGPTNAAGTRIGGNKFVLGSAEYAWDVAGPLRALAFVDAGQAYLEGQPVDLGSLKTSTGVELRFLLPVVNVPIRLIQAWNLNVGDTGADRRDFRFTFGTSF